MESQMVKKSDSHEEMKKQKLVVKLFVMIIFVGYILIFIMKPTNTCYLRWFPKISDKTSSTYFGNQDGPNLLFYTVPIIFIAILSCLYLHMGNKDAYNTKSTKKNELWAWCRRPVLVRGPLGIVSRVELFFLAMFVALLVWSLYSYLNNMFKYSTLQAVQMKEHVWEAELESSGLTLGLVGNACLAFLFFPVSRGSSILQLIGLTSEASIKYHIWLGHIVITIFTAHGLCYLIYWATTDQISEMLKWSKFGTSNVAGEVALLCGLVMWATSFHCIRRKIFELFYHTHHLYLVFVVFFVLHVGFSSSCILLPGFYLFLIDRFLRLLQSQQKICLVSARILPCEVVELNFSKCPGLSYTPSSIVFLNVPKISKLQWHPFTVTSSSNTDSKMLSVVVKTEGSWSRNLYESLSSPSRLDRLQVSVEGPYGPASTKFLRHDKLVMISGGSGITPFISIIRELLFRANQSEGRAPSILLICTFKKSLNLTFLNLILPISGSNFDISCLSLQIETYVTRDTGPKTDYQKHFQTIWFKPNASDLPVSAVLGQNSWLWLGFITSASLAMFLLLLAILTRYYIYQIDHNSNMKYPSSSKSALTMLLICVSVAIPSTAAFLWNKRQNKRQMRKIQNINMPTPLASPTTISYNNDREMESLPHQYFDQATKVHYGRRPNLKRILIDCEGSNVGVLVSGPKKMRQEVAAICSSGLVNNLHFESMSFSW